MLDKDPERLVERVLSETTNMVRMNPGAADDKNLVAVVG